MALPPPEDARAKLDELLQAIPDFSAPSTTKFDAVSAWFSDFIGLPVYTVWVSKAGNLKVRIEQRGDPTPVGVAILKDEADLGKCVRAGRKLVGAGRPCEQALVLCQRPADASWSIAAVIRADDEPSTGNLEAAFPDAKTIEPVAPPATQPAPAADLDGLADELYVDRGWLRDVVWLLRDKGGVIFYGPPGTGKTYIALRLAEHLQPNPSLRRHVQLHPSYGYEDFFEGFRPGQADDGTLTMTRRPGPLRSLSSPAADRPKEEALLVLDEMNRGNLPRVFGELYMALEYRDRPVGLMYSPEEEFTLPEKLRFIGTMNTADRSIALLDQALRRRFHFVGLFPGESVVDGIFERYLNAKLPHMNWLAEALAEANSMLGDRNVAIGPSHFMRSDLDETTAARIWRHSVLPTIEEHFFGDPDRLADFELERLRHVVLAEDTNADEA